MLDSEPLLWFTREFAARHPLAYPFGIPPAGRMLATAGAALEAQADQSNGYSRRAMLQPGWDLITFYATLCGASN
ncbi:MAG: hypothetical protein RSH26_07050, partial [Clostridia bacterium]